MSIEESIQTFGTAEDNLSTDYFNAQRVKEAYIYAKLNGGEDLLKFIDQCERLSDESYKIMRDAKDPEEFINQLIGTARGLY